MPMGTVTFEDGNSVLGTSALSTQHSALLTIASLAVGSHTITAVYGGDGNFNSTTSSGTTQTISAATLTWTGGDSSNNWSAAGNWVGPDPSENQVTPQASDDLAFAGSTRLSNTNDTANGTAYHSITFSSGGFTITGNALAITSGITANNAAGTTDNLNVAVTFSTAAPVITVSTAGAALSLGSSVNNGGLQVTVTGAGNTTIDGSLSGSGGLAMSGTGALTLSAANTGFTGNTTVNSGVVDVLNTGALGSGTVTENGGKVSLQTAGTISGSIGLQFQPSTGGGAGTAIGNNTAGVVPQTHWNTSTAQNGNATALKDSNNNATTAAVTWTAGTAWTSSTGFAPGPGTTP